MKLRGRFLSRFYSCVSPAPNHVFLLPQNRLRFSSRNRFRFWSGHFIGRIIGRIIGRNIGRIIGRIIDRIISRIIGRIIGRNYRSAVTSMASEGR